MGILWLEVPSNCGGDALAALLSGDENFSGRLPFTYPKHTAALHTYDYKVSEHRETMAGSYNYDAVMDVQWPFGHGLSYTPSSPTATSPCLQTVTSPCLQTVSRLPTSSRSP